MKPASRLFRSPTVAKVAATQPVKPVIGSEHRISNWAMTAERTKTTLV